MGVHALLEKDRQGASAVDVAGSRAPGRTDCREDAVGKSGPTRYQAEMLGLHPLHPGKEIEPGELIGGRIGLGPTDIRIGHAPSPHLLPTTGCDLRSEELKQLVSLLGSG